MRIVRTIAEMREAKKGTVALVPTMGAFHEGHTSLMQEGRDLCDTLVCSLFVNPKQFGPNEDYTRYPRNEERDAAMAEEAGVDVLFAPTTEEMYPGSSTVVSVKGPSDLWENEYRPGHFDGVATVVCKLFNIVQPHLALFGKKDLQQCAVVKEMIDDLNMNVDLRFCETVREKDGLAMSSRNVYLSKEDRALAPLLYSELGRLSNELKHKSAAEVNETLAGSRTKLQDAGFAVDYLALVNSETMLPSHEPMPGNSIIVAARIGSTRLIDNVQIIDR